MFTRDSFSTHNTVHVMTVIYIRLVILVDADGYITIKDNEFRVSEVLWELSARKNVNKEHVESDDMRKYKKM
jgi:hypothetical protein